MDPDEQASYHELCAYTLSRGDAEFIHQHVVDAWGAQHVDAQSKPIAAAFTLIGLYLHLERHYTGREVQLAHMHMARHKKTWPRFEPPAQRGELGAVDVLRDPPGPERDAAIHRWCASVWRSWAASHAQVAALADAELRDFRLTSRRAP